MNYERQYKILIERAKTRDKLNGYKENHHIIPTCIGGSDDKVNRVDLTAREHFIAHILLVKIHPNEYGLIKAVNMMCIGSDNMTDRINNRMYGWLRERLSKAMSIQNSISQKGELNSQFGSVWIYSLTEKVSKKIKKEELSEWETKGWLKGRVINFTNYVPKSENFTEEEKKERRERKKKITKTNNLRKKEEKKQLKRLELDEKVQQLREWYVIYRTVSFDDFKQITGYDKSPENMTMQFKKYLIEYESMDQKAVKKRKMESKLAGS